MVDAVSPADVWVMWKTTWGSDLARLGSLDPGILNLIEKGELTTFEALDTGAIPQALPPVSDG